MLYPYNLRFRVEVLALGGVGVCGLEIVDLMLMAYAKFDTLIALSVRAVTIERKEWRQVRHAHLSEWHAVRK